MSVDPSRYVELLKGTARDLVSLVSGADGPSLRREPGFREWSAATTLAHLADAELVYAVRLRMVVADDKPLLTAFDENAWAERFGALDPDPRESVQRWRTVRESNVRLLESLAPAEWDRTGMHQERGVMSVAAIAKLLTEHDKGHLDQIRAALAAKPRG
jgi:hypothetical protein